MSAGVFYKHKDHVLAWTLPMGLVHQVFSHEGADPASTALSAEILAMAPFSVRHICLHISTCFTHEYCILSVHSCASLKTFHIASPSSGRSSCTTMMWPLLTKFSNLFLILGTILDVAPSKTLPERAPATLVSSAYLLRCTTK